MNMEKDKNILIKEANQDAERDAYTKMTDDERIDFVATRILREYRAAFEELAK